LPVLKESGIDVENLENLEEKNVIEVMVKAIPILMETAPEIISDATGIEVDSLMCFPPQYLIELVTVAVQANMESKEALEKNFSCLMGMFRKKKEIQDSNAD
jgi:inosine/xanthosine triphosphate pyrophosphatase family protein